MNRPMLGKVLIASGAAVLILYIWGIRIAGAGSYFVLFRKAEICTAGEAWSGLIEAKQLKKTSRRISNLSKLRSTDSGGLQEWDTPFGTFWFPSSAEEWTVHFALAQYDLGAYPGMLIRQGDIVMDCGGYVGDWTKWAIKAGAAKVVIVEPAQEALQCLHRNLHKEIAQGRVIVYAKGVWDREGVLQFKHVEGNPAANTAVDASPTDEEKIQVTTIDRIVSELNLPRLDGIKMDIEGAEIRAIHGAAKTLNKFRPQIAIATEHTDNVSANNLGVVRAMAEVAPFYRKKCGICVRDHQIVTPQTLYFSPQ